MRLQLVSWNGDSRINDGTNYTGYILPNSMINLTSQPVYIDRAENFPKLSGHVLAPHSFTIGIAIPQSGNIPALRETLKSIFNITDFTPHALIAQDVDNGNKQWQLIGFPVRITDDPGVTADTKFQVTIAVDEPVWQSVTVFADTWSVTTGGPGNQRTINTPGNILARPKLTITPTLARSQSYQYARYCLIYNRSAQSLFNYPVDLTNGGLNTSALVNFTSISNQLNGAINNSVTTIPINVPVGGGLPPTGMGYVDSEQISWTGNSGGTSLTGVTRGIGGTTAASHLTGAVVALSKMLANGGDVAVQIDGVFSQNVWVDSPNTASTKIWFNQNWNPARQTPIGVALPNNGTAVTISFYQLGVAGVATFVQACKQARNGILLIDSELFTFSPANVDTVNMLITNCQRAQKGTSFAAHAFLATAIIIDHDIWLLYGNQNQAANPDNTQKPLLDLHNSTNTSWVQTNFTDRNNPGRPAGWYGVVTATAGKQSFIYTGNQEAQAVPATEMGMSLQDYILSNVWKAETANIIWIFSHPIGVTTVSISGSKYLQSGASWPFTGLQKLLSNNVQFQTVWSESIPPLASWTAFAHAGVALGATFNVLLLVMSGSISAAANNKADIQFDTVTLTLDNTQTPVFSLGAEVGQSYYLNCTITNTTTGDAFLLTYTMLINHALVVDCNLKTITYDDGSNAAGAITPSTVRNDWLTLVPGNNVLQFDDLGTTGVTVLTNWQDRTI